MAAPAVPISGANLLAGRDSRAGSSTFTSFNPRRCKSGDVPFHEATPAEVNDAVSLAVEAFPQWRASAPATRAAVLRDMARRLADDRDPIVAVADAETALGAARLNGELDRTCGQLRAFADQADEGSFVEAIISTADPAAAPPGPDVRRMLVPLGPVAVFTPSNFPLAFGVAGGDVASALAAGCPVVVKGHPSHPGTSEMCARILGAAIGAGGAPAGILSLLQARSLAPARALVTAPGIEAVGFTGSQAAGRAIHDLAAARPRPIPVYAEMGSLNPVFVSAAALAARSADIADGLAGSITLGTGQFCTKPGLVFVPDTEEGKAFGGLLATRVATRPAGTLLNPGVSEALDRRAAETMRIPGVTRLTPGAPVDGGGLSRGGTVLAADADTFLSTAALQEEHFGPLAIVVFCAPDRMRDVAGRLAGHLTATVHAEQSDREWAVPLADVLATRVGRLVWNGYPTGVAVTAAMHHGGPYPASTAAAHTSVGATAIRRFLRPVAWQSTPDALLPAALRDGNPLGILRQVDGRWTSEAIIPSR